MKKRRGKKKKKTGFFSRHAWLIVAAIVLSVLSSAAFSYVIFEEKSAVISKKTSIVSILADSSEPAAASVSTAAATFEDSVTSTLKFLPLDLSYDTGVYVYSKKKHVCNDYKNIYKSNYFSMRCKVASGVWRGHLVKKIDVAGYAKLRVKASLGVKDYTDYFAECGHKGINRGDFITLMALSYDPEQSFRWDCNHEVVEAKWQMCQVKKTDPGVLASCNLPMCSNSINCDLEIDVEKQSAIYLLFSANDAWVADVEGSLSNVEYSLIK